MTIPVFMELVEMKAKIASVLPCLIGVCFSWYYYSSIHWYLTIGFFIAMFLFNMFVDIWDNYNDYQHADNDVYQQHTNIIGREHLSLRTIRSLLIIFFVVAMVIGLALVWVVGWPMLAMGVFCFAVGLAYSAGPRPLSSLPLGELFSGFTMGFMITLICVYLNTYQMFTWDIATLTKIFLIALPNTLWISNLMLANNLCDKEEDESNHRYTIVHYIGIKGGLYAFASANVLALVAVVCQAMLGLAPYSVLLTLLLVPFIYHQTRLLWQRQVKRETFICAVRILAVSSVVHAATYCAGIIINNWLE